MMRRMAAALAGGLVAFGVYGMLPPPAEPPPPPQAFTAVGSSDLHLDLPSPQVDPTPVRLVISAIGVDARIEARGLDPNRNLATPNDYRDVAWYDLGPHPGDAGNAVLNGHVNWWTGDAVFTHLSLLRAGDLVRVVRADGGIVTFKVTGRQTVDANARIASLFAPSARATMTLITCTGAWDPLTQSDTHRLLVSAALV